MNNKFTPENAQLALDLIARGTVRPTKIAAALGITYRCFANWLLRSTRGDETMLVEQDGVTMQFAKAVAQQKRFFYLELRSAVEEYSLFGRDFEVRMNGQVVWAIDPEAAAIVDPDVREICGFRRDALVEIDGRLQPVTEHHHAPIALQLRVLEVAYPKEWRPGTVSEVNLNGSVSMGIGFLPKPTYAGPPPAAIAEPAIPQIEDQSGDAFADVEVTEGETVLVENGQVVNEEEVVEPTAPAPEPVTPDRGGELQRTLLARLEENRMRGGMKVV